jgi:hypothetical protein
LASLAECPGQGLVVQTSCGGDEDEAVYPFGRCVGYLEGDGAAHRVTEENGLVDGEGVEERDQRLGQVRDVEDVVAALTTAVAGQVRDDVDIPSGEHTGGWHEVLPGDREAVNVHDRYAVGTCASPTVDRRPTDVKALRHPTNVTRHGRIVSRPRRTYPGPNTGVASGVPASSNATPSLTT